MSAATRRLLWAALACLPVGVALGLCFAWNRGLGPAWRPVHVELNVFGFASLLVLGIGIHVLPRFAGRPPLPRRSADSLSFVAIAAVLLGVAGWATQALGLPVAPVLLAAAAAAGLASALGFTWLVGPLLLNHSLPAGPPSQPRGP